MRLERAKLIEALGVDLFGRARGGRPGLERPGVIGVAVRQLPDAGVGGGGRALAGKLGDLAVERGRHLLGRQALGAAGEIAGEGGRAPGERGNQAPFVDRLAADGALLAKALVEQEIGRDDADAGIVVQPFGLAIERGGIPFHAGEIGLRVGGVLDLVVAVQRVRDLDEGAGILGDHVRRVAVGPVLVERGDVAEREGEAFERGFVGGPDHVEGDPRRGGERGGIDRAQAGEALRGAGGNGALAFGRTVGESGLERCARAGVEPERRGVFRIIGEQGLGDAGELLIGAALRGQGGEGGREGERTCAQQELAAVQDHRGLRLAG